MKWRFDDMTTFLVVMETGSITSAASRLGLSKSVVSKRINDLEAALGTALFQRHAGRLAPTETGDSLAERVRPLIAELNDVAAHAAWGLHGLRGKLTITAPVTFSTLHLSPIIAEFAGLHPELDILLDYDDRIVDLVRGGFDVGLRVGELRDSSLIARKLCSDRRAICCSPDYVSKMGWPERPADLKRHDFIDYAHMPSSQLWQFRDSDGSVQTITPRSRIAANNGEAMRDLAVAGLGLAMLPMFILAEPLRRGDLIQVLPDATLPPLDLWVVYPPAKPVPPKVRAIVDHLAATLKHGPLWDRPDAGVTE
jgi:DNA-binding transcriptional LysR family regulator